MNSSDVKIGVAYIPRNGNNHRTVTAIARVSADKSVVYFRQNGGAGSLTLEQFAAWADREVAGKEPAKDWEPKQ